MFPNRRSRIHLFAIIRSPPPPCFAFHENLETRSCSQGCTPLDAGLLICFPLLALPSTPPSSLSSSSSLFLSRAHTHTHTHWTSHQPLIVARIPNITIKFEYRWSEFKQSYGDRSRNKQLRILMHAQILLNLLLQRTNAIFLRIRGSTGMVERWVDWSLGGIQGVHRATYKFTIWWILRFSLSCLSLSSFVLLFFLLFYFTLQGETGKHFVQTKILLVRGWSSRNLRCLRVDA